MKSEVWKSPLSNWRTEIDQAVHNLLRTPPLHSSLLNHFLARLIQGYFIKALSSIWLFSLLVFDDNSNDFVCRSKPSLAVLTSTKGVPIVINYCYTDRLIARVYLLGFSCCSS